MTKFENPSFGSGANSRAYRDNWEKVFGQKAVCKLCKEEPADSTGGYCCVCSPQDKEH